MCQGHHIAFSAIRGVLADSAKHKINANQFAIAGDSAGGNLATCLELRFQQEGLRGPKLQILLYPALDARMSSVSYRTFAKGLNLTERTMRWFWQQYGKGKEDLENPLSSPACADDKMLQGLRETLIITSEFDMLHDEAEDFAKRLRSAGVSVCSVRFGGVLHGFMVTESLAKDTSVYLAIRLAVDYLCRLLNEHPMPNVGDQASGMRCDSL